MRDRCPGSVGQHDCRRQQGKRGAQDPRRDHSKRNSETSEHEKAPFLKGPPGVKTVAALAMQPPKWYGSAMGKSSIAKQLCAGAGSSAALELGRRVRERRLAIGITQSELAAPLSRGFVSAVEKGRALPSLGALWLFAARLGTGVGNLVDDVNGVGTSQYTPTDDHRTSRTSNSGRHHSATSSRPR